MTESAVQQVWTLSLAVYLVVVIVVAVLLTMILRTARDIRRGVLAIWNVGQKIANNTIQIPLLVKTNHLGREILESASGVALATLAIKSHAEGCPGCPSCVLGRR